MRTMEERGGVKRVAVISYHSSPLVEPGEGNSGGMTIYVRELSNALAALGLHTDIFTRATGGERRITELSVGVRVIAIEAGPPAQVAKEALPGYLDEFTAGVRAMATAQRIRYDLVHSHYWQSGLSALALAADWGVPHVHSHHTLGLVKNRFLAPGDSPEPASRIGGENRVIGSADVLVASTDEEWDHLACLYGASHDHLKTLRPGVDHGLFYPGDGDAARRELGLSDELVMLYVGRIQPLKGVDLAINAMARLEGRLERPLVFIVVGGASGNNGGGEIDHLRGLAAAIGVESQVRFVGAQPHTRLPVFYRAADALVVCSHSESFGLAALEAHACATPVLGTAVGGLSYVVRDGVSGFLVETRDPDVFAARLEQLFNDAEMRAGFRVAAAHSAADFSWSQTASDLSDLYDCLARERSPELCVC